MTHTSRSAGEADALDALDMLVEDVVANRAAISALQSREVELLASAVGVIADRARTWRDEGGFGDNLPTREVSAELGAAMLMSDRTVQSRIGDAHDLVTRFTATFETLRSGSITLAHATAIVDAGTSIVDDVARATYEELALQVAGAVTVARLREAAKSLAAQVDPEGADDRIRRAQGERRVQVLDLSDGMARLIADLPAVLAHAVYDTLTRHARSVRAAAEDTSAQAQDDTGSPEQEEEPTVVTTPARTPSSAPDAGSASDAGSTGGGGPATDLRTMDEIRADILADILLTTAPTCGGDGHDAISAIVQITIPAATLIGRSQTPALLAGYGPIDADTARCLAGATPVWDRVFTDPATGVPLAVDRYRPSEEQRRLLRARDERCRFPGCRQPVHRCEIDHTIAAADGGATTTCNLAHVCKRHHILKHNTAWTLRQLPNGTLEWTSPARRVYLDRPPASVRFVPVPEPVPGSGSLLQPPPF